MLADVRSGRGDDGEPSAVDEAGDESFPASDSRLRHGDGVADRRTTTPRRVGADGRPSRPMPVALDDGTECEIDHGAVVIAAITSCTNTSNPSVMIGAALLAKKAVERGLTRKPWVKTSLAPGSKVVTDYYERAGLMPYLDKLGFNLVGYGCTTCIGNSGPLPEEVSAAVNEDDLAVVVGAVGQPQLRGPDQPRREDELPRVAAARRRLRAGRLDGRRPHDGPAGQRPRRATRATCATSGRPPQEIQEVIDDVDRRRRCSPTTTPTCSPATSAGTTLPTPTGDTFEWDADSTYVRKPPYFDGMQREPQPGHRHRRARGCWRSSATR